MTNAIRTTARGNIWAIAHRCYQGKPHFKHSAERRRYLYWLFQARRRFGLSILNFSVHPNMVHLLLMDKGRGEIPSSLQTVAERMECDVNRRTPCSESFWESLYQAAIVRPDESVAARMAALDVSVVHAGLVSHPLCWRESGYYETLYPPTRARRVDVTALQQLLNPRDLAHLRQMRRWGVSTALHRSDLAQNRSMTLQRSYRLVQGLLRPAAQPRHKLVP